VVASVAAALLLVAFAASVLAHGPASIKVDPMTVTAGQNVTISVAGVEPDQDRVIVLIGQGIVVPFPTVRTDASGSFTAKVMIPSRLPGGIYRFEAIGDETLTGDVEVIAAAGGIAAQPPADQTVPDSRTRGVPETAVIVAFAVVAMLIGLVLIMSAERFRGSGGA
jgi:hypothetical protein